MLFSITLLLGATKALAPLEFEEQGQLYMGPWYYLQGGDSVNSIIDRVNHKPWSLFQSDFNISSDCQPEYMNRFFRQLDDSKTDAIAYVTLYPILGFDNVTDGAISQVSAILSTQIQKGRKIFLRYGSEMNGNWFVYGRQPVAFVASWKRVIGRIKEAVGYSPNLAVVWAPNGGIGYPWGGGIQTLDSVTMPLDTNGDGKVDANDDPFSPYYPGDEWVDWVGLSVYWFGPKWPWEENEIPTAGLFETILSGGSSSFSLYDLYSGNSRSGKPFMVTETAATVHMMKIGESTAVPIGPGRVAIRQSWWRQYLNSTLLQKYPKFKSLCTFEFIKPEETTWRDFTIMGDTGTGRNSPLGNDGAIQDGLTLFALQQDLKDPKIDSIIKWSSYKVDDTVSNETTTESESSPSPASQKANHGSIWGPFLEGFLFLYFML